MTREELQMEMEEVLCDIESWSEKNRLEGKPSKDEIARREFTFMRQQILYEIEEAKDKKDCPREIFNVAFYHLTTSFQNEESLEKKMEIAMQYFAELHKYATTGRDEKMIAFCHDIFDVYDEHKVNGHIPRPNGKE